MTQERGCITILTIRAIKLTSTVYFENLTNGNKKYISRNKLEKN